MAESQPEQQDIKPIYLAGILAWLVPGAGHWYLGEHFRGGVICVAICGIFLLGVTLGGVEIIDPHNIETITAKAWFYDQLICGVPSVIGMLAQDSDAAMGFGRGVDLGRLYVGVAGLLNLLCIMDVLMPRLSRRPTRQTTTRKA